MDVVKGNKALFCLMHTTRDANILIFNLESPVAEKPFYGTESAKLTPFSVVVKLAKP